MSRNVIVNGSMYIIPVGKPISSVEWIIDTVEAPNVPEDTLKRISYLYFETISDDKKLSNIKRQTKAFEYQLSKHNRHHNAKLQVQEYKAEITRLKQQYLNVKKRHSKNEAMLEALKDKHGLYVSLDAHGNLLGISVGGRTAYRDQQIVSKKDMERYHTEVAAELVMLIDF